MAERPAGSLFLGETTDPKEHARTGEPVWLDRKDLTTHGLIVGMTGSGKTGLGVVLLEEALGSGVPVLVLDPKGDVTNLALTFPSLSAEEFAPWVEGGDGAGVAATWSEGLAGWGLGPEHVKALHDGSRVAIYTPGSSAGIPLNVVGSLAAPADTSDLESLRDEVQGYVSGVLGLVGVQSDPLSGREHVLLATLIEQAWVAGQGLDLAGLVAMVPEPPVRKLGVFDVDTFFPPKERTELALKLNGLLASPSFAAWSAGPPLDVEALLRSPDGRPSAAVVSLAHLSDEERQLVVTRLLHRLITWMRRQDGTDDLRLLVYFDEVLGFAPPTEAPPSKKPILTLMKQARAFGVGMVLTTQNPVDLDYKTVGNAGTWMIGRLQTEKDKERLLEGLRSAAGDVDVGVVGDTIGGLEKREFVLREAGASAVSTFTSRWAMSYLRGPLTQDQIATLMADAPEKAASPAPTPAPHPPASASAAPAAPVEAPAAATEVPAGATAPPPAPEPATEVPAGATAPPPAPEPAAAAAPAAPATVGAAPPGAEGVAVAWLDPAAPWAPSIGLAPTGTTWSAAAVATVDLLYDDDTADLRHQETWEAVLVPLVEGAEPASWVAVDHDPRDLKQGPPAGLTVSYAEPGAPISTKGFWSALQKDLVDHLYRNRPLQVQRNKDLKLWSRAGETPEQFAARCTEAADLAGDAAAAKLTDKYASRIERARGALATAQDRVAEVQETADARKREEVVGGLGDLLGGLLGGRSRLKDLTRRAGTAVNRRGRTSTAGQRVESAKNRVDDKQQALIDLEADLAQDVADLAAEWDAKAAAIEQVDIPLEKSDITVRAIQLVWVPTA